MSYTAATETFALKYYFQRKNSGLKSDKEEAHKDDSGL